MVGGRPGVGGTAAEVSFEFRFRVGGGEELAVGMGGVFMKLSPFESPVAFWLDGMLLFMTVGARTRRG